MVVVIALVAFSTACSAYAGSVLKAGGLTAYPTPIIGNNLLKNADFESIDTATKLPSEWAASKAFSIDTTVSHAGKASLRLKDAPAFPYAESARQKLYLRKGTYRFSGWVKTEGMSEANKGVRLGIAGFTTALIAGTTEWRQVVLEKIAITKDDYYEFNVQAYSEPSGTAWFDSIELRRENLPVDAFLLYPNYRGMLFDDQAQTIRLQVTVDPPEGTSLAEYVVESRIEPEGGTSVTPVLSAVIPLKDPSFMVKIDGASLLTGRSYLLRIRLLNARSRALVYEYPAYNIVKVAGADRAAMTVSFDEHNRFLVRGKPTFFLGVYDAGLGYFTAERQWVDTLTAQRRLFELPLNLYINYWYGGASALSMQLLMNVLQASNILYLQTGNCFDRGYDAKSFKIDTDSAYLQDLSSHKGLAGFYTADECVAALAPTMFVQYQRLKTAKPDGITFGATIAPESAHLWRDTLDVIAPDPYPLYGVEPSGGYPLGKVADWTRTTRAGVQESRPIMTVLQFFQGTSNSRWPNRAELRTMSYMAITEGANGLLYWSLGVRALSYVCKDWCPERVAHFEDLKAVMNELKGLEPALVSIDRPDLLAANGNATAVRTRVKYANGKAYLIAYNATNLKTSAAFTWKQSILQVRAYGENRLLSPVGTTFSDSFGPYEAHVYEITTN